MKPEKEIIETFSKPFNIYPQKEPSSFNGAVRYRKYRITIEQLDEPQDVLEQRLQKLWDECDNHHHWDPLKKAAASIGYTLIGGAGKHRKK